MLKSKKSSAPYIGNDAIGCHRKLNQRNAKITPPKVSRTQRKISKEMKILGCVYDPRGIPGVYIQVGSS
jgi:hypothetical protein